MANAPPEKQRLMHTLSVIFRRPPFVSVKGVPHVAGKMIMVCRPCDLKKIMLCYDNVAQYSVVRVEDGTTGQTYPEFKTELIENYKED